MPIGVSKDMHIGVGAAIRVHMRICVSGLVSIGAGVDIGVRVGVGVGAGMIRQGNAWKRIAEQSTL